MQEKIQVAKETEADGASLNQCNGSLDQKKVGNILSLTWAPVITLGEITA